MLPIVLLAASLVSARQASIECVDTGAQIATTQTGPVRGPGGMTVVLKVSTADDHSKNSHLCHAEYQLIVTPAAGGAPSVVYIDAADGSWGRTLFFRLDGFSRDGKRIFGILTEGGKWPITLLFDYDMMSGNVQLVDLKQQFARIIPASCSQTLEVIGTSDTGEIVLELNSSKPCSTHLRWLIDPAGGRPQRLSPDISILGLYKVDATAL